MLHNYLIRKLVIFSLVFSEKSAIIYNYFTSGKRPSKEWNDDMLKFVFLLPGLVFGAAEFFLLRAIINRAMDGRSFLVALMIKLISYAAILVPVFMIRNTLYTVYFGIGAGAGLIVAGLVWFLRYTLKEKR